MKSRLAAAAALAAALMLGTTGCTFGAEIATQKDYDPSDGVGTTIGAVGVRNALLIGDEGDSLNLVMTVTNSSDSSERLIVQWEAAGERVTETVTVEASGITSFGGDDDTQILVEGTDAEIGGLYPVFFTFGDEEGSEILVPVLDGSLPEYELFVPSTAGE